MDFNKIIYNYITLKTMICVKVSKLRIKVRDTTSFLVYNNNCVKNCISRYYFIKFLLTLQNLIQIIIDKYDINFKKVHVSKEFPEGYQKIILESENEEERLNISGVVSRLQGSKKDTKLSLNIITNFEIVTKDKVIDIKKYTNEYRDTKKLYNHTLENIILFNKIGNNSNIQDSSVVHITRFIKERVYQIH